MTTTSFLQKYPDYYETIEDCINFNKNYNKEQSNPRYKNFVQINFTAGDEEQFQKYRYEKNNLKEINPNEIDLKNNLFLEYKIFCEWEKYKNIDSLTVTSTFKYIFEKFKKGIFVKIVDNKLKVFLPFSNVNFVNEWSSNIKIDPKYNSDMYQFFKHISELEGRTFNKNTVNNFINSWYSNNCLVRYEYPINEGDTNVSCVKNMLEELCEKRIIPDIEFFINRRDFPLLTKNGYEPYYHLWNSMEKPLISHSYKKYSPILSMCSFDNYSDILMPLHDDWIRVQGKENKFFPRSSQLYEYDFDIKWEEKISTAVFRGSSTGSGVTIEKNQRLKLAFLSYKQKDNGEIPYLDAGITKWNVRPKKVMGNPYLQTIDLENIPFNLVSKLSPIEQSKYKYIIHVDGHVSAFRLSYELSMNSVILIVKSKWKLWYSDLLIPYEHYIPIKEDLSDIFEIIEWCRNNDNKCKNIAENAKKFYEKYLQKDSILDYLQKTFIDIKKTIGNYSYNDIKPVDVQIINEYKNILHEDIHNFIKEMYDIEDQKLFKNIIIKDFNKYIKYYPKNINSININNKIPNIERCYGLLKGYHYYINKILHEEYIEKYLDIFDIIFENKLTLVKKVTIANFDICIKTIKDKEKIKEHIHESFVGLNLINNLLEDIPNFSYIFGIYKNNNNYNIISEFINGKTLQNYIKSDDFSFKEYLLILIQLSLSLEYAQRKIGFVHYDLTAWNIMIQKLDKYVEIEYKISHEKVYKIKTNIIPIIVDYGKSHVIYENKHHGFVNMYKFSTVIDLLTTTIYEIIINKNLSKNDFIKFLKLANFISNTKYHNGIFKNSKDVKTFFYKTKKYSHILYSNKYELENYTPLDLINYILEKLNYNLDVNIHNKYNPFMKKSDSIQVYNYILSNTIEEKINSYLSFFENILKIDFVDVNEDILKIYYIEELLINVKYTYHNFNKFLELNKFKNKHEKIFYKSYNYLLSQIKDISLNICIDDIDKKLIPYNYIISDTYDDKIFLFPDLVKKKLNNYIKLDPYFMFLLKIKNIVENLLLYENNIKYDKNYYKTVYKSLLIIDDKLILNNFANINTLDFISKNIY